MLMFCCFVIPFFTNIRLLCHLLVCLCVCVCVGCIVMWHPFQCCCTAAGNKNKNKRNKQRGAQLLLSIIADTHGRPRRIRNFRAFPLWPACLPLFSLFPFLYAPSFLLLLFVLPIAATCLLKTLMPYLMASFHSDGLVIAAFPPENY